MNMIDNNIPDHLVADFDQLRKELKSIALSVGPAYYVSLDQLDRDFADITGERIAYYKYGFASLRQMVEAMPDDLALIECEPHQIAVVAVTDESLTHLERLINGQRAAEPTRFGGAVPGMDNDHSHGRRDRRRGPRNRATGGNGKRGSGPTYRNSSLTRSFHDPFSPPTSIGTASFSRPNRRPEQDRLLETFRSLGVPNVTISTPSSAPAQHLPSPIFERYTHTTVDEVFNRSSKPSHLEPQPETFDPHNNLLAYHTDYFENPPPEPEKTPFDFGFVEKLTENVLAVLKTHTKLTLGMDVETFRVIYETRFPQGPQLDLIPSNFGCTFVEFLEDNLAELIDVSRQTGGEIVLKTKIVDEPFSPSTPSSACIAPPSICAASSSISHPDNITELARLIAFGDSLQSVTPPLISPAANLQESPSAASAHFGKSDNSLTGSMFSATLNKPILSKGRGFPSPSASPKTFGRGSLPASSQNSKDYLCGPGGDFSRPPQYPENDLLSQEAPRLLRSDLKDDFRIPHALWQRIFSIMKRYPQGIENQKLCIEYAQQYAENLSNKTILYDMCNVRSVRQLLLNIPYITTGANETFKLLRCKRESSVTVAETTKTKASSLLKKMPEKIYERQITPNPKEELPMTLEEANIDDIDDEWLEFMTDRDPNHPAYKRALVIPIQPHHLLPPNASAPSRALRARIYRLLRLQYPDGSELTRFTQGYQKEFQMDISARSMYNMSHEQLFESMADILHLGFDPQKRRWIKARDPLEIIANRPALTTRHYITIEALQNSRRTYTHENYTPIRVPDEMRHRFLNMLKDFGQQGVSINKLRILYSTLQHRRRFMELYGYVTVDSLIKALELEGFIEVCPNAFGGPDLVKLKNVGDQEDLVSFHDNLGSNFPVNLTNSVSASTN